MEQMPEQMEKFESETEQQRRHFVDEATADLRAELDLSNLKIMLFEALNSDSPEARNLGEALWVSHLRQPLEEKPGKELAAEMIANELERQKEIGSKAEKNAEWAGLLFDLKQDPEEYEKLFICFWKATGNNLTPAALVELDENVEELHSQISDKKSVLGSRERPLATISGLKNFDLTQLLLSDDFHLYLRGMSSQFKRGEEIQPVTVIGLAGLALQAPKMEIQKLQAELDEKSSLLKSVREGKLAKALADMFAAPELDGEAPDLNQISLAEIDLISKPLAKKFENFHIFTVADLIKRKDQILRRRVPEAFKLTLVRVLAMYGVELQQ